MRSLREKRPWNHLGTISNEFRTSATFQWMSIQQALLAFAEIWSHLNNHSISLGEGLNVVFQGLNQTLKTNKRKILRSSS